MQTKHCSTPIKMIKTCLPENIILRSIMSFTRATSLLFYRGKKTKWAQIKRVAIKYNDEEESTQTTKHL